MPTRTPSPARARSSSGSRTSARSGKGKRPAGPARARSRTTSRSGGRTRRPAPWPVRAVRAAWMSSAHVAGAGARRIGTSARDLDPELRRDGIGLTLIGLAIVVAATEWWGLAGPVGRVVHAVVAGTLGRVGLAVPLVLLALGIRLLRHPQESQANSRVGIGLAALTVAVTGMVHLSQHIPSPSDGADRMRDAGGMIGFLAASPLAAAVTGYGAIAILVLVGLFGVLVVTATPVHAIPDRVLELRDRLFHHDAAATAGTSGATGDLPPNGVKASAPEPADAPASVLSRIRQARGSRADRAAGAAADDGSPRVGDEAFETPLERAEREASARAGLRPGQRRPGSADATDRSTGAATPPPPATPPATLTWPRSARPSSRSRPRSR